VALPVGRSLISGVIDNGRAPAESNTYVMRTDTMLSRFWRRMLVRMAGLLVVCGWGLGVHAETGSFDPDRFDATIAGKFEPFDVRGTLPLRDALEQGAVVPETWVLVTETAEGRLALLTEQMAYHHVAQGVANGVGWMATF
jgi:hypothetical protein